MEIKEMLILMLVSSNLLLFSCSDGGDSRLGNQKKELVVDTISSITNVSYYPSEYDQSIVGLCNLFDAESLNVNVLKDYENYLFQEDELFLVYKDTYCKLHIANGGSKGEFQSITVAYQADLPKDLSCEKLVFNDEFKTNNNIKLGMTVDEFLEEKPQTIKLEKVSEGKFIKFSFFDGSMPYRANYVFSKNRLIQFDFGFAEE